MGAVRLSQGAYACRTAPALAPCFFGSLSTWLNVVIWVSNELPIHWCVFSLLGVQSKHVLSTKIA